MLVSLYALQGPSATPSVDLAQSSTDITIAEITYGNARQPKEDGCKGHDIVDLPSP